MTPWELKVSLVTGVLFGSLFFCPGELLCGFKGLCCSCSLLQHFCSSLHTSITQILTGIACSLGFRLAFQISCSAKELIFIFLSFIRAKDSIQEITSQRIAAFQRIKFSIPKAVQNETFTCMEAPFKHFSRLDLEVCR